MPLLFTSLILIRSILAQNRIECDDNASISKGCHLHDYDFIWRTHTCQEPHSLWCDSCVKPCEAGFYQFGSECLACSENCKTCSGPEPYQCSECNEGFVLDFRNVCILNCNIEGKYGTDDFQCVSCNSQCLNCFQRYDTACISCREGANLQLMDYTEGRTNSGYCLPAIQRGFGRFYRQFANDHIIFECPPTCSTCTDKFVCTSCIAGYSLHPPEGSGAGYVKCYPNPT